MEGEGLHYDNEAVLVTSMTVGYDNPVAVVSRRHVPRMFVVDTFGDVLLAGAGTAGLDADTRAIVARLISAHPLEDVVLGLTGSGEVIRLLRLHGSSENHHAVFIEPIATRSPVDVAVKRFALSHREAEILQYLLQGASTAEMAARLIIAASTVASHVRHIGGKMNAFKRKEIVAAVLSRR